MCHTEMCYRTCFMRCLSIQIASLIIRKHNILHKKNHRFHQYEAFLNFILLKNWIKNQQPIETKGIKNTNLISYQQISLILLQQWNTKHNSYA